MKLTTDLSRFAFAAIGLLFLSASLSHAKKLGEDEHTAGKEVIPKPTHDEDQSILDGALREIMQEFSSHITALHDPFFFSRRSFFDSSNNRPFSSWDPFALAGSAQSVTRWSPRYEVVDDENTFVIKVDVPGFHFHEMNVELEAGGRVLVISGLKEENVAKEWNGEKDGGASKEGRETSDSENNGSVKFSSHTTQSFQQKFTLDPSIDSSKMSANLNNGLLIIRAPRERLEINKKHIPITQFDEADWKELISGEVE